MRLVELRPRMATLNVCTMSFGRGEFRNPPEGVRRLAARMRELGSRPSSRSTTAATSTSSTRSSRRTCSSTPIACSLVLGVSGGMSATAENFVHLVGKLPAGAVWQVIGVGRANLPMTAIGLAMGGNARTGMEDTLWLRRGCPAQSNAELIGRLAALVTAIGRERATVDEAATQLRLATRGEAP